MTTGTLTGPDLHLREAVRHQLDWDPEVDATDVAVSARHGVVTLTGTIDTYAGKLAAERAVKRVRGVRVVANDLVVRLMVERTDSDIAADVAHVLRIMAGVPEAVQATVHDGHVTLTGTVDWLLQKEGAEEAVRFVRGIRGVVNRIEVVPTPTRRDIRRRIIQALHRSADVDRRGIDVAVSGDVVTLTGTTRTWVQRDAAELAAGSAPGVRHVENRITVVPAEPHPIEPPDELC